MKPCYRIVGIMEPYSAAYYIFCVIENNITDKNTAGTDGIRELYAISGEPSQYEARRACEVSVAQRTVYAGGGKEKTMKAEVYRKGCISCGLCVEICPSVFRMEDDGPAEAYVDEVPRGDEEKAVEAQENCPVSVITVEE